MCWFYWFSCFHFLCSVCVLLCSLFCCFGVIYINNNNNNNNFRRLEIVQFRRLADASQPSLKMPGKRCFCSSACPWPFNRATRSPSKTQCPPNESALQPLTLFFNIYALMLCAGRHTKNNNNKPDFVANFNSRLFTADLRYNFRLKFG